MRLFGASFFLEGRRLSLFEKTEESVGEALEDESPMSAYESGVGECRCSGGNEKNGGK